LQNKKITFKTIFYVHGKKNYIITEKTNVKGKKLNNINVFLFQIRSEKRFFLLILF